MEGFGDALDGYFDPADQLSRYFLDRAAEQFADERATKRALDSQQAFENRRQRVREQFLSAIGGLPDRPPELPVETTGRIEQDGYTIESLTFESHPNHHVTANCYVPDEAGPFPAVLFCCGHVDAAKGDPYNQKACIELVQNGFVVLIFDPISQGERIQYVDSETGEPVFSGSGGVFGHCYAGQQCFSAGLNLARYMVHDARCGLDYLSNRSDVDSDRLGVTGTSGGGTQTLYLALLDDRIDAAAPCCSVTDRREWLKTGKRIDAEQVIYGAIPRGINYDDLTTAMAPKPLCIGAAASDEYFPIEGVHEAVERTREVYELYDAADAVALTVADETHCSVYELGDGVFDFFCETLGDDEYTPHEDHSVLDESELHCTPDGSVLAATPSERTIDDLVREDVAERYPDAGSAPTVDGGDATYADELRQHLVEQFGLDREGCELHPRFVAESERDGLAIDRVWFKTERDPEIVVAGVLVSDPEIATDSPAVVLYEEGTEELPDRTEETAALAREYGTVFVFDPRGVGAVKNREIPIPWWVESYDQIYGTEFKLAYDALLMGDSLLGMRVYDILRAAEFLRAQTDSDSLSVVGRGLGAYHALYAAAAARNVEQVDVEGLGPSFIERVRTEELSYVPQLTVFDVVGTCDIPHLRAALDQRGVHIV